MPGWGFYGEGWGAGVCASTRVQRGCKSAPLVFFYERCKKGRIQNKKCQAGCWSAARPPFLLLFTGCPFLLPLPARSVPCRWSWSWGTAPRWGRNPPWRASPTIGWCSCAARSTVTFSTLWRKSSSTCTKAFLGQKEVGPPEYKRRWLQKKNVLAGGGNNCLIAWPGRVPPPPLLFLSPPTPTPLFAWLPAGREPRDPARSATPQPHARANPTRVSGKSPQRKGPSGVECLFNAKFSPYQVLGGGGVSRGFCGEGAISSWVWRGGELGLRRNQHSASLFIPEKSPFLLGFASNTCNGAW